MYDHAVRRLARGFGREKGLRVFIPAEELERAGYAKDRAEGRTIYYRATGGKRGAILVQLYRSP